MDVTISWPEEATERDTCVLLGVSGVPLREAVLSRFPKVSRPSVVETYCPSVPPTWQRLVLLRPTSSLGMDTHKKLLRGSEPTEHPMRSGTGMK